MIMFYDKIRLSRFAKKDYDVDRLGQGDGVTNKSISDIMQDYERSRDAVLTKTKSRKIIPVFTKCMNRLDALLRLRVRMNALPESEDIRKIDEQLNRHTTSQKRLIELREKINTGDSHEMSLYEVNTKLKQENEAITSLNKLRAKIEEQERIAKKALQEQIVKSEKKCQKALKRYIKRKSGLSSKLGKVSEKYTEELKYYWGKYPRSKKIQTKPLTFSQECAQRGISRYSDSKLLEEEDKTLNSLLKEAGMHIKV